MKVAIFTLTKGGKEQGLKLKKHLPWADLFQGPYNEESFGSVVRKSFSQYDLLIFIMATGIVVRLIGPLLQHKSKDPGVLVMDERGRNIISLLSGHMGGANEWTMKLAKMIKANPVITTASDTNGIKAVDTFAMENSLSLTNWTLAKEISAYLVNGGEIPIYTKDYTMNLPEHYKQVKDIQELKDYPYGIIISDQLQPNLAATLLQLFPRNLVIGIGCRKDTPVNQILDVIQTGLMQLEKPIACIHKLVTVDVKEEEEGLIQAAKVLRVPLEIIPRDEIIKVEHLFQASEFVKKTIGVSSVSEPCAMIGSKGGEMLLRKEKSKGITLSVAKIDLEVTS